MSAARPSAPHRRFITFEGVDGAGKSTHIDWFAKELAERCGDEVVQTREPGGTPLGEALRALILHQPMHLETEALLMFAARRQHLADVIEPALARGAWIVCDRFTDASIAYQGGGRGLATEKIAELRQWVHPRLDPGLTILFDIAPEVARQRLDASRDHDRFEREAGDFFERVRSSYLRLATEGPTRFRVIDGAKNVSDVRVELEKTLINYCL